MNTTFLKRNGTNLPFVQKAYDLLQKKGSLVQVLAIACFHAFGFCFTLGFFIVEVGRIKAILSWLFSLWDLTGLKNGYVKGDSWQQRRIGDCGDEHDRTFDMGRRDW
ncbi:MAG: hypothetical protein NZ805_05500 [Armatimonadetes bacterium]|nr:hypothetical protein [Armatimonadota bacterium]